MTQGPAAKRRDPLIDALKGVAILLVLAGHAVQYARGTAQGNTWFFANPLYQAIYMFHMPLFALLSGYLATRAMQRTLREVAAAHLRHLLLPTLMWTAVYSLARWGATGSCSFRTFTYWYIWTIVCCSLLLWLVLHFVPKGYRALAVVTLCAASLLPEGGQMLKFLFPFYALGYAWAQHPKVARRHRREFAVAGVLLFCICFALWRPDTYVYLSDSCLLGGDAAAALRGYALRFAAGLAGSATTVGAVDLLHGRAGIPARLGGATFGLYMMQHVLYSFVVPATAPLWLALPRWAYHPIVVPAVTLAVLSVSLGTVRLIRKSPVAARWMLGTR